MINNNALIIIVDSHVTLWFENKFETQTDYILERKLQVTVMWLSQLRYFHLWSVGFNYR